MARPAIPFGTVPVGTVFFLHTRQADFAARTRDAVCAARPSWRAAGADGRQPAARGLSLVLGQNA